MRNRTASCEDCLYCVTNGRDRDCTRHRTNLITLNVCLGFSPEDPDEFPYPPWHEALKGVAYVGAMERRRLLGS